MKLKQPNAIAEPTVLNHIDRAMAWFERPQVTFPIVAICVALVPVTTNFWSGVSLLIVIASSGYKFADSLMRAISKATR